MPKVVDRDERKRVIVEAAWRIIAERGIDGVTMRDLASATGYANGALARYFSGKQEILELAYERIVAATDRRIASSVGAAQGLVAVR
ncbi:MAG: helix-turn-helix domain-containing protein, partial [Curtobacterium sp.]